MFKHQWRRIRLSLREEETERILKSMEKHNRDLGVLLGHKKRMTPLKAARGSAHAEKYRCIRQDAERLYRVMKKALTSHCACEAIHTASLRLETRDWARYTPDAQGDGSVTGLLFTVLLSFEPPDPHLARRPWDWRETCFEPLPTPSSDAQVEDRSSQPDNCDAVSREVASTTTLQSTNGNARIGTTDHGSGIR